MTPEEPRFHVGDIVRVREWNDMAEEFGLDSMGDILCPFSFTTTMRYLCGHDFRIVEVDTLLGLSRYHLKTIPEDAYVDCDWDISEEMLCVYEEDISIDIDMLFELFV